MKPGCFFLLFLWLPNVSRSQEPVWHIEGIVYDEAAKALPYVTVYVNNTSIGVSTDIVGKFTIIVPGRYKKVELVASHVGYMAEAKQLAAVSGQTSRIVFKLSLNDAIREVVVHGKRDRHWRRKWKIFENGLYGDSPFARQCKILNPEAISLDDQDGLIKATASEPVLIENQALGYRITFHMRKFESNGKRTFLSGYKFFQPSFSESLSTYEKQVRNREKSFSDSFRNFLVSLALNTLKANDIELFTMKNTREFFLTKIPLEQEVADGNFSSVTADSICSFDRAKGYFILHSKYPLLVFQRRHFNSRSVFSDYPFQYSQIVLPNGYCIFSKNGWLIAPNGITIHDAWAREGFAEMLPIDYQLPDRPAITTPVLTAVTTRGLEAISSAVKLPTIEMQQTITDKEGLITTSEKPVEGIIKADYELTIRESDLGSTVFDLLKRIPGLRVTFDARSNMYKVHFIESNANITASTSFDNTVGLVLDNVFYSGADTVIPMLNSLTVRDIRSVSAVRYGNAGALGARGAHGAVIIVTNK